MSVTNSDLRERVTKQRTNEFGLVLLSALAAGIGGLAIALSVNAQRNGLQMDPGEVLMRLNTILGPAGAVVTGLSAVHANSQANIAEAELLRRESEMPVPLDPQE